MPTVFKPFYKTAFISRGVHDIYMGSAWCLAHVLVPDWPALNNDALPLSTDGTITIVMKISNHGNMLTKYGYKRTSADSGCLKSFVCLTWNNEDYK